MGFNAKKAVELRGGLEPGVTTDGIIIDIQDGKVEDYLSEGSEWQGDKKQTAINLVVETSYKGKGYRVTRIFTYNLGGMEETIFYTNSNLAKYKKFYRKLPEVSDVVKLITDADGFWRITI